MSDLGDLISDIVKDTLGEYGAGAVTLRKVSTSSYSPSTGAASTSSADYAVNAAFSSFRSQEIDGTTVLVGDRRCTISANGLAVAPVAGDLLIESGITWRVVRVLDRPELGGTLIGYDLHIRK